MHGVAVMQLYANYGRIGATITGEGEASVRPGGAG